MSEAKKRPSGAFSARLHRRGITIDATCPVPSIVPLPRKRLTFSATGSVSPLSVSRCGNTASESLLLRQIKPLSFDGGFIFYSALSANWAFLPLLPQHLSCGEDGVANALRAGTEDLAGRFPYRTHNGAQSQPPRVLDFCPQPCYDGENHHRRIPNEEATDRMAARARDALLARRLWRGCAGAGRFQPAAAGAAGCAERTV